LPARFRGEGLDCLGEVVDPVGQRGQGQVLAVP
jgi:hypothetical protein